MEVEAKNMEMATTLYYKKNTNSNISSMSNSIIDENNELKGNKKTAKPKETSAPKSESVADEIKKFSDLKDQGILTQEEFDAKKKELLGL